MFWLAVLPLALAGASPLLWPSLHHDGRNSGTTNASGPGTDGVCCVPLFPRSPSSPTFATPGVTSASLPGVLYAVSTAGAIYTLLQDAASGAWAVSTSVALASLFPGVPPLVPDGAVVAAPEAALTDAGHELLLVASGDGHVYAVDLTAGAGVWVFSSQRTPAQPFFSPPRYVRRPYGDTRSFVVVSETDANLNVGGVLHCLDATTGALIWSNPGKSAFAWGIVGTVPSLLANQQVIAMGIGADLLYLRLDTGVQCEIASTNTGDQQIVSSSATDGSQSDTKSGFTMFIASTATYVKVWHVSFSGTCNKTAMNTYAAYSCAFRAGDTTCGSGVAGAGGADAAAPGGWLQPTSAAQRDALHGAITTAHSARYGEAATAAALAASPEPAALAAASPATLRALGVARLAAALPRAELHSLAPGGYARKGGVLGEWPLSTPALRWGDASAAFMNYQQDSETDALFEISEGSHAVLWQVTALPGSPAPYAFSVSRSSPAIDAAGALYVGGELNTSATATAPVLLAVRPGGAVAWAYALEAPQAVGAASPIVLAAPGGAGARGALLLPTAPAAGALLAFTPGAACPGAVDVLTAPACSGHGACNAGCAGGGAAPAGVPLGACACKGCWWSADGACAGPFNASGCGPGGACGADGTCACALCYAVDALTGRCVLVGGAACGGGGGGGTNSAGAIAGLVVALVLLGAAGAWAALSLHPLAQRARAAGRNGAGALARALRSCVPSAARRAEMAALLGKDDARPRPRTDSGARAPQQGAAHRAASLLAMHSAPAPGGPLATTGRGASFAAQGDRSRAGSATTPPSKRSPPQKVAEGRRHAEQARLIQSGLAAEGFSALLGPEDGAEGGLRSTVLAAAAHSQFSPEALRTAPCVILLLGFGFGAQCRPALEACYARRVNNRPTLFVIADERYEAACTARTRGTEEPVVSVVGASLYVHAGNSRVNDTSRWREHARALGKQLMEEAGLEPRSVAGEPGGGPGPGSGGGSTGGGPGGGPGGGSGGSPASAVISAEAKAVYNPLNARGSSLRLLPVQTLELQVMQSAAAAASADP